MTTDMAEQLTDLSKKEIANTNWWGRGISLTLLVQAAGLIWFGAQLAAQVKQNTDDIAALSSRIDQGAAVSISREQLEDILGSRDAKLDTLERSMSRIEAKIDRLAD